ncbi:MAG: polymerase sigma factor [Gemmataceae bacterium]|nr:polymerase sigma factor [Gemmataceae bacterium]
MHSRAAHFSQLIGQFQAGDHAALAALYAEYGGLVREAVRRRLPDRLRKEYDSLDFAQDVWASFCHLPPGKHHFATPEDLGGFLVRVAHNKVIDVCRRRLGTQGYDVTREQPLVRAADGADVPVPDRQPTPSQWAIAAERWAEIAAALPAQHVAVIERLREGFTQQEVAAMAGITDRTVRRIVDRVRELCEDGS